MDLHNPKVERAIIEHVRFANHIVEMSLGEIEDNDSREVFVAIRQQIILVILNYTLAADWKLKNTLLELNPNKLAPGENLEDFIL